MSHHGVSEKNSIFSNPQMDEVMAVVRHEIEIPDSTHHSLILREETSMVCRSLKIVFLNPSMDCNIRKKGGNRECLNIDLFPSPVPRHTFLGK
jgi:hypothetical protein